MTSSIYDQKNNNYFPRNTYLHYEGHFYFLKAVFNRKIILFFTENMPVHVLLICFIDAWITFNITWARVNPN